MHGCTAELASEFDLRNRTAERTIEFNTYGCNAKERRAQRPSAVGFVGQRAQGSQRDDGIAPIGLARVATTLCSLHACGSCLHGSGFPRRQVDNTAFLDTMETATRAVESVGRQFAPCPSLSSYGGPALAFPLSKPETAGNDYATVNALCRVAACPTLRTVLQRKRGVMVGRRSRFRCPSRKRLATITRQ